ncbi:MULTISPECIES: hypothetical protein [unclassified Streptomyces]|uniref:hypothetical protein n=1 Tax=unclassified Streptomyces TaxID=2593676 RepID=UPI00224D5012|nr:MULTISPECIES: hypothetical protein [unclassified Streptomyces]MCX4792409.1 hypothetical protein [Streptomyces sp. NBC_01221]MCX4799855.1 hypothetical protein [Streptomyces sp. NBC_01242]WSJ41383.1 hypothetical protein OG772_37085 [Streptomyces sp. NBC_01321]WSP67817.1 hypothetical protein OG466_39320 [Streptomyces sp. NBC_01240]
MKLNFESGSDADLGPGRIAVCASTAQQHGLTTGSRINARTGHNPGLTPYTVVGVCQDNPTAHDALGPRTQVQPQEPRATCSP